MNKHEKSLIIQNHINENNKYSWGRLSGHPVLADLLKFSNIRRKKKWSNNKRYIKKFFHNWQKYVPISIYREFMAKTLTFPLRQRTDYSEIASKLVKVEPLSINEILNNKDNEQYILKLGN